MESTVATTSPQFIAMEVSNLKSTLADCGMASEGDSILDIAYLNNQRVEEVRVGKAWI